MAPQSKPTVLSYDGTREVEVNRGKVNSVPYLRALFSSNYSESSHDKVSIKLDGFVTFEVFKSVIDYAQYRYLESGKTIDHYLGMLRLAELWIYDELIQVVQSRITDLIRMETDVDIHTLANLMGIERLKGACVNYERSVDRYLGDTEGARRCDLVRYEQFDSGESACPSCSGKCDMEAVDFYSQKIT